jgi:hypothetical protein
MTSPSSPIDRDGFLHRCARLLTGMLAVISGWEIFKLYVPIEVPTAVHPMIFWTIPFMLGILPLGFLLADARNGRARRSPSVDRERPRS